MFDSSTIAPLFPNRSALVSEFCRPDFITISLNELVGGAIAKVRRTAQPGNIFYLYVANDRNELCGIVSIRSLLLAQDNQTVCEVYSPKIVTLQENSPVRQAYQVFANSRFLSLPVIDAQSKIIGVVHAHEIAEGFKTTAEESLFEDRVRSELFGLLGVTAEDATRNPGKIAVHRLPWLIVNITGGTLCAAILSHLGGRLSNAVEFLAFAPVLLVVSESIGMQSASLAIANLHQSSRIKSSQLFLKEWAVAGITGSVCALIMGFALYLWKGSFAFSATVSLTILLGCLMVSFVGNAVPFLFHRWKIDPRIAAGPVVLSIADCATLLLYFLVAIGMSHWG